MLLERVKKRYRRFLDQGGTPVQFLKVAPVLAYRKLFMPGGELTGYRLYTKPLIASYSRSGTNWVRYFIEVVTGRPTPGDGRHVHGRVDYCVDRAHAGFEVMDRYPSVLFLLRNYKECIVRQHKMNKIDSYGGVEEFLRDESLTQPANNYIKNIEAFDQYSGPKCLVYYEDLIAKPEESLMRIAEFLELPRKEAQEFVDNLEHHKSRSIQLYTADRSRTSETRGDAARLTHHADKNLSEDQKRVFDDHFRTLNPALFEKYCSRYAE